MKGEPIYIVSGLPRSGTSMMMKMLAAGGLESLTDNIRSADEDNPNGYFEFESVKSLDKDSAWLNNAKGKAVKIISELLKKLPSNYHYRVIFMHRKMEEILASQKQMLIRRGKPTDSISDEKMAQLFQNHLKDVETWLSQQPNLDVLYVHYNEVLQNPAENIQRINVFLGGWLDEPGMAKVIDKALYRQRK